jgi:hypothetical protein
MSLNSIKRIFRRQNADEEEATAPEHNIFHYLAGCYCSCTACSP